MSGQKVMKFGYANKNCRQAVSTQIEAIQARFPGLKVGVEEKGEDDEFNHLIDTEKKGSCLGRGKGHQVVVAEFHHLATSRDQLAERLGTIHSLGSFVTEAKTGLSTEDRAVCPRLMVDAIEFYETGLTGKRRSEIAAHAAKFSSASTPKKGRMPHKEAQRYLCDMSLSISEAIASINKQRKYKVPWTLYYAYREKRAGRIDFPNRAAGRRPHGM